MSLLPLAAQTANDVAQQCADTEIFPLWLRVTHFIRNKPYIFNVSNRPTAEVPIILTTTYFVI